MASAPLGVQVRPYRDYLTPALHSRFTKASRYTLLLCYLTALFMGEWDNRKSLTIRDWNRLLY
jgi:nucleoporin NDC1